MKSNKFRNISDAFYEGTNYRSTRVRGQCSQDKAFLKWKTIEHFIEIEGIFEVIKCVKGRERRAQVTYRIRDDSASVTGWEAE